MSVPAITHDKKGAKAQPPRERTAYVLIKLGQAIAKAAEEMLEPLGLTGRKFNLLATAAANPSLSQREIGELLGLDPNTVVDILDGLEDDGLITRHPSRQDRRRHELRPTPDGLKALARADQRMGEAERELLAPLTAAQANTLHEHSLKLLISHMPHYAK
jgi:DNA-binding MarR family transcriptional regulator